MKVKLLRLTFHARHSWPRPALCVAAHEAYLPPRDCALTYSTRAQLFSLFGQISLPRTPLHPCSAQVRFYLLQEAPVTTLSTSVKFL